MYVVTFYSFKGGVGRTMALANAAFELSQRGRRVLVVDFDLEAPGIPTFSLFAGASNCKGVVDYVTEYLQTGQAPDIAEFVIRCEPYDSGPGSVWCMPAGKQDHTYAARLNSIDWQGIYRDKEGYLLIEDMKNQWKQSFNPDYVLIDSRTGHTDVGGICTRQLPNAVCALFLPNDENIIGLKSIVTDIRQEKIQSPEEPIELHFVPSNVPNIDDEEGILQKILEESESSLDYNTPSATIHHYDSLDLLRQIIFTSARKRTQLAKEYRELVDAIIIENLEDREGAKQKLENVRSSFLNRQPLSKVELNEITSDTSKIEKLHGTDGEILHLLGLIHRRIGTPDEEIDFQTKAIEANYDLPKSLIARATAYRLRSDEDLVVEDLLRILDLEKVDSTDVFTAVKWIEDLNAEMLGNVANAPAVENLDPKDQLVISHLLSEKPELTPQRETILRRLLDTVSTSKLATSVKNDLILVFNTQRHFNETLSLFGGVIPDPNDLNYISTTFNIAMSEFGRTGEPSPDLFCRVVELDTEDPTSSNDANYCQCLAVSNAVCGAMDRAVAYLEKAREIATRGEPNIFSCWRYQHVTSEEFLEDLDSIENWMNDRNHNPPFTAKTYTDALQIH